MTLIELTKTTRRARFALVGALGAATALGLAVLYGTKGGAGNGDSAACASARAAASRIAPLAAGELAALKVTASPRPLPALSFSGPDGKPMTLADFKGRTVLLNLWATWCVPCREEMPALAALQRALGGPDFQVTAVNIDTRDPERAKGWLADNKVEGLVFFADPSAKIFQDLKGAGKAFGMPTTLLVSSEGCEIANLAGPARWDSPDAVKLVRAALGG